MNNYRPISLLNAEVKVFERLIFKHIFNHLQENSFHTSLQSGFMPGDSTVNQLTFLYNIFCQVLNASKEIRGEIRDVFCDISKPVDCVWNAGLIRKLEAVCVTGKLLEWFKTTYLTEDNVLYSLVSIPTGQHICWRSKGFYTWTIVFFLIFINDIVNKIDSCIRLFADGTSLFIIVDDPAVATERLYEDLIKILQ